MNDQYSKYADDIEDFLSGNMNPEREKTFKEALENNAALSEAYRFRTIMANYWNEEKYYSDTKERVRSIVTSQKHSSRIYMRYLYLAASVLVLTAVSVLLWQSIAPDNSSQEYAVSNDSSKSGEQPFSISKQPEKASLYMAPVEYSPMDSLILIRKTTWPDSGTLLIMLTDEEDQTKDSYTFDTTEDTLIIPLKYYKPGTYKWEIKGENLFGSFILKNNK